MATNVPPGDADIFKIPLATAGEFELSDKECSKLRSRIYSLNKHHVHGWRWRTLRNGPLLLVWRVK